MGTAVMDVPALYQVQDVKQADGSVLRLCPTGRYLRACRRLYEVSKTGDAATIKAVQAGVNSIEQQLQQLRAATPDDSDPPTCDCDWCRVANAHRAQGAAMGEVRAALWAMLMPAGDGLPPLVGLVEGAKDVQRRDALWAWLKLLSDNLQAFGQAATALGEKPKWEHVWPG